MRKFFAVVALLMTIVSCSKNDDIQIFEQNDVTLDGVSTSRVTFSSEAWEQITIKLEMMESWEIELVSDSGSEDLDFTVSKMSGDANCRESVVLESTASNDTQLLRALGVVNILSAQSGELLYSISVDQNGVSPTKQTTFTYFTGVSLNYYYMVNLIGVENAIERGDMGDGGRYIYYIQNTSTTGSLYELVLENGECVEQKLKDYTNINSLYVGSLSMVMEDVKSHIGYDDTDGESSQRLNLVVSGHGTGWVKRSYGALSSALQLSSVYEWESNDPSLLPTRYMGLFSNSSEGCMDIEDFVSELSSAGVKFGYILFDMCLMSSVEVLYRLRDYADYIVASPSEVMAKGFPYDDIMQYMYTNGGVDFDLQSICETYYNSYASSSSPYACVAVCVMSELEALATSQKALNLRELTTSELSDVQSYDGRTGDHVFFDLGDYISIAADGAAQSDIDAYDAQFERAFPEKYRFHTAKFYTVLGTSTGPTQLFYYSGVTTSQPTTSKYSSDWLEEPWAVALSVSE